MKAKCFFAVLVGIMILVACAPKSIPAPTETATPFPTSTPVPQTSTPTVEWLQVATPLDLSYNTSDEIISIMDEVYPGNCIKERKNLLTANPTPVESAAQIPSLTFTEITTLPEPKPNSYNERADNIDDSRTAIVSCQPGDCSKIYITDNTTKKSYEIRMGGWSGPYWYLHWINKDTVTFVQEGHFMSLVVAINVDKQQFEYYGNIPGCPNTTATP